MKDQNVPTQQPPDVSRSSQLTAQVTSSLTSGDGQASAVPVLDLPDGKEVASAPESYSITNTIRHVSVTQPLDTSFKVGVDTILLWLKDYRVTASNSFSIKQPSVNGSTGEIEGDSHFLYSVGEGEEAVHFEGEKAFYNHAVEGEKALFSATIHGDGFLFVQASLPRILSGSNVEELRSPQQVEKAYDRLTSLLKEEAGIVTSLEIGNISRLDICRTVTLPRLVPEYQDVIRNLTFPRMKATHYYSGARWSNKQREISLYDKTKEQTATRGKEGEDSRECRLEYRLTKGEAVANHYGSKVAYDLTTSEGFQKAQEAYSAMTDKLFSLDVEDLSDACETGVGPAVERLSEERGGNRKFLAAVAAHFLTQQQKEEAIRAAAKDHRQKASRLRKDLQEGMKNAAYLSEEGKTEATLYAELKAAFTGFCDK